MNERDRDQLQLWLDGMLPESERASFEQRLACDPELRAERDLHEDVLTSVRRSFAPPPSIALPATPQAPAPTPAPAPLRWPWFLLGALAAAVAILCWAPDVRRTPDPAPPIGPSPQLIAARTIVGRSWAALYNETADRAARAAASAQSVTCEPIDTVPQLLQPLAPDVEEPLSWCPTIGVTFCRGLDAGPLEDRLRIFEFSIMPSTTVLVFVVRATDDPHAVVPTSNPRSLNLFRAEHGPLVVYELTPLTEQRVLNGLESPR